MEIVLVKLVLFFFSGGFLKQLTHAHKNSTQTTNEDDDRRQRSRENKMTTFTTIQTTKARDRQCASKFLPRSWMNDIIIDTNEGQIKNSLRTTREEDDDDDEDVNDTDSDEGNIIANDERAGKRGTTATTATSKLKQKLRESRKKETRKVEFMQKIIEEQKLLLMDEQARSNQFEQQVKLLQKSVKLLEKECDSLSVKMSEMFEKNAEKAHLNERIRQAERAAMVSARETKRVVEENRESHHVIREQNKRINKLEKRLEEQVKKLEVSKKANELMRAGRKNNNIDAKPKTSEESSRPPPTKQLAPEEIDWEAAYEEIDELREAKRMNAR